MKRWLVVTMMTMGLALGACGSVEKGDGGGGTSAPTWTPLPDDQALVGQWGAGADVVTFEGNGRYRWDKEIPCGRPPCPNMKESGTYRVVHGKLYMTPANGNDTIMEFSFADQQQSLSITDNRGAKQYSRR